MDQPVPKPDAHDDEPDGKSTPDARRILSIDVGGSHLKAAVLDAKGKILGKPVRIETPLGVPPEKFVEALTGLVKPLQGYDCVSIGFPGYVRDGKVFTAPNLGNPGWKGFGLAASMEAVLAKPVRLANDADVQGLAAIAGKGLELVCTLGTGFGTGWFRDGAVLPHMELAHMRIGGKKDLDRYLGERARLKVGNKKWNRRLEKMIAVLAEVLNYDRLYLGGGNAEQIGFKLPPNVSTIPNADGLKGGAFLWRTPRLR